jgi:hypothetical protein
MMNRSIQIVVFAFCLTAMTTTAFAQEVKAVLSRAANAMAKANLKTLRFAVAGTGYEVGPEPNPSTWKHITIASQRLELDAERPALRKGDRLITVDSPWAEQFELWSIPQMFLRGAAKDDTFLGEWKQGDALYNLVIFKVQDKLVSGYFNRENLLEIVETRIQHPILGDTLLQVVFTDYKDYGGIKLPSTIIQKMGGSLVSVLIVSDVHFE